MKEKFSFDPLADYQNYREALRQMLEGGWVLPRDLMPSAMNAVVAAVDLLDNGTELVVKASLPGVKPCIDQCIEEHPDHQGHSRR
jgi:HSP20 family molecular chaperone IbpA